MTENLAAIPRNQERWTGDAIAVERRGRVLHVQLRRPEVRNAMNAAMVEELRAAFAAVAAEPELTVVVLRGVAGQFSAGGDIRGMRKALAKDSAAVDSMVASNHAFGRMLLEAERLPQWLVSVVEGAAMGGGMGLIAVSDCVLALASARIGTPEVTLGLVPAQILPFLVKRLGKAPSRRLTLMGSILSGREAKSIGLVDELAESADELERLVERVLERSGLCGPKAVAATKSMLRAIDELGPEALVDRAAELFSAALVGEEGREGTRAFLEGRPPNWARNGDDRIDG